MAEGLLRHLGGDRFEIYSAGTQSTHVHPLAIKAMSEKGVDISHHTSDRIDKYMGIAFDYVITVCDNAQETFPYFSTNKVLRHWSFEDPSAATGTEGERLDKFREIRDQIEISLQVLL